LQADFSRSPFLAMLWQGRSKMDKPLRAKATLGWLPSCTGKPQIRETLSRSSIWGHITLQALLRRRITRKPPSGGACPPIRAMPHFPGQPIDDNRHAVARIIDEQPFAGGMRLTWWANKSRNGGRFAPESAVDAYSVAAIRVLMLTGARLREVLHAKWEYVDFDRAMIFLPDSKTGRKPIYLSAATMGILSALPRVDGNPYLFPGKANLEHDGGKGFAPRADLKKPWAAVTGAAGLKGLRIHDLRPKIHSLPNSASYRDTVGRLGTKAGQDTFLSVTFPVCPASLHVRSRDTGQCPVMSRLSHSLLKSRDGKRTAN
jgi:hypothetical protein